MTCTGNISGIEKIYTAELTGDSLSYYYSGDTLIIDDTIEFNQLDIVDDSTSFTEKRVSDTKGQYFQQTISCVVNDYLSDTPYDLENKNIVAIFKDMNGYWLAGYEQPLSVDKIESKNEKDNTTAFTLNSNSYVRVKPLLRQWAQDTETITFPI